MKVTKMHGLGNDYVYVDGFKESVDDPPALARAVSDRHFGIGGDGLIIIRPPTQAGSHCRMEMYNADGSRAQMCGNGIRCVAKYAVDHGLARGPRLRVESDAGEKLVSVAADPSGNPSRSLVTVGMGWPRLAQRDLPARVREPFDQPAIGVPLELPGLGAVTVTLVSIGNPHCVVRLGSGQPFREALDHLPLEAIGPSFENHPAFPERINTEFVVAAGRRELHMRVWERGSGETLACGTGACAAAVAGVLGGWLDREATVHLRGGDLTIRWESETNEISMTGPAVEVFTAEIHPGWLLHPR
jgi:diaminopimelate epimerase